MKRFIQILILIILFVFLTACSTAPVVRDAVVRPLPTESMRKDSPLLTITDGDDKELKEWVGDASEKFGMCISDKKALIEYILRNYKSEK